MYTEILKSITAFKVAIEMMAERSCVINHIGEMTLVGEKAYYVDMDIHYVVIREKQCLMEVRSAQGEVLASIGIPEQDHNHYLTVIKKYLNNEFHEWGVASTPSHVVPSGKGVEVCHGTVLINPKGQAMTTRGSALD